jgi:hypothetical protein
VHTRLAALHGAAAPSEGQSDFTMAAQVPVHVSATTTPPTAIASPATRSSVALVMREERDSNPRLCPTAARTVAFVLPGSSLPGDPYGVLALPTGEHPLRSESVTPV